MDALVCELRAGLESGFTALQQRHGEWASEQRLVGCSSHIDYLPILPAGVASEAYSKHYEQFQAVFDPSSYGQYLGGTQSEPPGWFGVHHEIGRLLGEQRLDVVWEHRRPFVVVDGQRVPIVNLHIHSKKTAEFMP